MTHMFRNFFQTFNIPLWSGWLRAAVAIKPPIEFSSILRSLPAEKDPSFETCCDVSVSRLKIAKLSIFATSLAKKKFYENFVQTVIFLIKVVENFFDYLLLLSWSLICRSSFDSLKLLPKFIGGSKKLLKFRLFKDVDPLVIVSQTGFP